MNEFPQDLQQVFRQYREALPDPEPSVNFTPMLWEKIEARRSSLTMMRRLTHAFVSLATAAALVLGVFVIPQVQERRVLSTSYAEVVAEEGNDAQEVATAFAAPLAPVTGVPAQ
ncbi:hypothetical protein F183_A30610 [Bryobacterales bacterium F-183]|nr:hypothetical protein F183_A30610 [Bryobacterales bacterium F-183]